MLNNSRNHKKCQKAVPEIWPNLNRTESLAKGSNLCTLCLSLCLSLSLCLAHVIIHGYNPQISADYPWKMQR